MKNKTITLKAKATQFNAGDESFLGHNVRNQARDKETGKIKKYEPGVDEEPFAMVEVGGKHLKVSDKQWLVELPNGQVEVWSDDQINGSEIDARLEDDQIKAEAADKLVVDYKEHNPSLSPLDGNAPDTKKAESNKKK